MSLDSPDGQSVISSDGQPLGSVVGVHRDTSGGGLRWAVIDTARPDDRYQVVPFADSVTSPGGIHIPVDAAQVFSAPRIPNPTQIEPRDEALLTEHYRSGYGATANQTGVIDASEAVAAPPLAAPVTETVASVVRSEEQLRVSRLEWRPYKRLRVRTVVRSREVTHTIVERWQELVIEEEPTSMVERLTAVAGFAAPDPGPIDLVLHREEVVVSTRLVPYEHVRVSKRPVDTTVPVEATLRRERVEIDRGV